MIAQMPSNALGLDFGTTNTVISRADAAGELAPVTFRHGDEAFEIFRSALCFWHEQHLDEDRIAMEAGPWAIDRFIRDPYDCRFMQSLKSFAASRLFEGTSIFERHFRFEDLLATFFRKLWSHGGADLDPLPSRVVVGRPVAYVGRHANAALAMKRYEDALRPFGFTEVYHVYEPVAAAFFYARRLIEDATILVADFGGGTTDFSVMRFEVDGESIRANALAHSGVGVAGDRFDYRIIDHVVSPLLGKGTHYRSMGKVFPIPQSCYASFASWHMLSVMKTSRDFRDVKELLPFCTRPELLERLVALVETDQGYPLYKAVSQAKEALSRAEEAELRFATPDFALQATVRRAEFEAWIEDDLLDIEEALDEALVEAELDAEDIDRVFLTGGTSFVPAVRRLFEVRFGKETIETGSEFVSIANGLALIGEREDIEHWTVRRNTA